MKRSESSPLGFYTIAIAALFLAGFLLLVVFGAKSYRKTVGLQEGNMDTRALLSYLAACVKANDTADGVRIRDSGYGQVLVAEDGNTGYAMRIYLYDGSLVEDYAAVDADLRPEDAQIIGRTETFSLEMLQDDLLSARTDAGRVLLRLRSEGGGA